MKKILVLGVIAVLLSAGLVLASCDSGGCPGDGKCGVSAECKEQSCAEDMVNQFADHAAEIMSGTYEYKCNC